MKIIVATLLVACALAASHDKHNDRYDVQFVETPAPSGAVTTPMTLANGSSYNCVLPTPLKDARPKVEVKAGDKIPASAMARAFPANEALCVAHSTGWWIYQVCWNKHVRQFHLGAKQTVEMEFFLGYGVTKQLKKGATGEFEYGSHPVHGLYAATQFLNGTECDLNGVQRQTEVRVFCPDQSKTETSINVQEPGSCKYVANVFHRGACSIPGLERDPHVTHPIVCHSAEPENRLPE